MRALVFTGAGVTGVTCVLLTRAVLESSISVTPAIVFAFTTVAVSPNFGRSLSAIRTVAPTANSGGMLEFLNSPIIVE